VEVIGSNHMAPTIGFSQPSESGRLTFRVRHQKFGVPSTGSLRSLNVLVPQLHEYFSGGHNRRCTSREAGSRNLGPATYIQAGLLRIVMRRIVIAAGISTLVVYLAATVSCGSVSMPPLVLSYHNDAGITGQNLIETVLTPANVNSAHFGKVFSYPIDGQAFAQPLYVANVRVTGKGVHNVVFVATEHDSVYAFDADGIVPSPLWSVNFTNASAGITTVPAADVGAPMVPEVGITGTPVIDRSTGTLFVVAATKENGTFLHRLHALDVRDGREKFGGPVQIQASVAGIGAGSSNGQVAFQSLRQLQRCALTLAKGVVYIAFASYGDQDPYHGWIIGYDAATLEQAVVWNTTPNGQRGGIWMAGAALSWDSQGSVFAVVGNGTFDVASGGQDYGDSVVKLTPSGGTFTVTDYFTPFDESLLESTDMDLGSSGFTLLPDQPGPAPHLGVAAGKAGKIYLLNRENLGKFQSGSDSQIVQSIPGGLGSDASTATYWQRNIYYIAGADTVKQFQFTNGLLSTLPVAQSTHVYGPFGGNMSISANGAAGGVLWAIEGDRGNALHAYDATNVANELYNSNQAGSRDQFGSAVKFSVPTVINGRVYVAGQSELAVFGLL
jgi:hypothetical protein